MCVLSFLAGGFSLSLDWIEVAMLYFCSAFGCNTTYGDKSKTAGITFHKYGCCYFLIINEMKCKLLLLYCFSAMHRAYSMSGVSTDPSAHTPHIDTFNTIPLVIHIILLFVQTDFQLAQRERKDGQYDSVGKVNLVICGSQVLVLCYILNIFIRQISFGSREGNY